MGAPNTQWSSIEEIAPPVDAAGRYTLASGQPYGPERPVWHYEAPNRSDFFSSEISGAMRLHNGNTLICAGVIGHLFEVTPAGETVWQYVNPVVRVGIRKVRHPGRMSAAHLFNAVFKVERYAPDYPGLRDRDLAPKRVIERAQLPTRAGRASTKTMRVRKKTAVAARCKRPRITAPYGWTGSE